MLNPSPQNTYSDSYPPQPHITCTCCGARNTTQNPFLISKCSLKNILSQRCRAPGRRRWWEHGAALVLCTPVLALLRWGHRLRLAEQPAQSLVPALPLQLCSHHFPALLVVLVHPVTLQKGRGSTFSMNTQESLWPYTLCTAKNICRSLCSLGLSC